MQLFTSALVNPPYLIVSCNHAFRARLVAFLANPPFGLITVDRQGDTLVLDSGSGDKESLLRATSEFIHSELRRRYLRHISLLWCQNVFSEWQDVLAWTNLSDLSKQGAIFLVRAQTNKLRQRLLKELPEEVAIHPKTYTHIFYVSVLRNNEFLVGIRDRRFEPPNLYFDCDLPTDSTHPSRAFRKLEELHLRFPELFPASTHTAVDIGASPGGWTQFLAPLCAKVIAVDPGALDAEVSMLSNVIHLKHKVENCMDALKELSPETSGGYAMVVCDMNCNPRSASEILLMLYPLMCDNIRIIFTIKLVEKYKREETVVEVKSLLQKYFKSIQDFWLFSNGRHERTLIACQKLQMSRECANIL